MVFIFSVTNIKCVIYCWIIQVEIIFCNEDSKALYIKPQCNANSLDRRLCLEYGDDKTCQLVANTAQYKLLQASYPGN